MNFIALALKKFRENSGYTQQQMANALSMERSTYAYYETGKTSPSIETIIKIKNILNVYFEDFLESDSKSTAKLFDLAKDQNSFSRVNIYELNKKEKNLVSLYRTLEPEIQNKILKHISEKLNFEK